MHEAQVEGLPERRRAILHKAEGLLLDEQPYLVLLTYRSRNLVSPKASKQCARQSSRPLYFDFAMSRFDETLAQFLARA
jgi:hypothetical protein